MASFDELFVRLPAFRTAICYEHYTIVTAKSVTRHVDSYHGHLAARTRRYIVEEASALRGNGSLAADIHDIQFPDRIIPAIDGLPVWSDGKRCVQCGHIRRGQRGIQRGHRGWQGGRRRGRGGDTARPGTAADVRSGGEEAAGRGERRGGLVPGGIAYVVGWLSVVPGDWGGGGGMRRAHVGWLPGGERRRDTEDGGAGGAGDPLGGIFVLF
ncbi:hypothetical protein N658DRAFT_481442 [Parathielavia hyrcaniae]|uniref:Uncharacterized protein n=1 Tax=Parathielavia hyrcaniae TaxID=113614 RepID=A0AAN6PS02_9PEZI|nr:hypothetical protein N658DRAFT_481442 [Parathielavia hyrcaniae]